MGKKEVYFIVREDDLAAYGNCEGSSKEEVQVFLEQTQGEPDMRVIRGVLVDTKIVLVDG